MQPMYLISSVCYFKMRQLKGLKNSLACFDCTFYHLVVRMKLQINVVNKMRGVGDLISKDL